MQELHTPYWIKYIKNRIAKNKNFLCFISGQTGSGKSWSSLSIGESLDSDFNISHVVFRGIELMDLINSGKLHPGSVIVFEEAGIEMNARNWQSVTNKMLNFLLQTFRHRNFILLFNSPYMDFVDASTRRLFHAEFQTQGIDFKQEKTILKPQLIQYNSRIQKFYYKRLRVRTKGVVVPINIWRINKPSDSLIKAYEEKKRLFTNRLNKEIYEELEILHHKRKKELTEIQQDIVELLKKGKNVEEIAKERGRALSSIYACIRQLKRKGLNINPIFEGKIIKRYEIIEE